MSKKIITVFGATGAQGGGMARAILNDKNSEFAVRAVTRNTNSDKAKDLAKMGAELVQADVDDEASIKKALDGSYGAFFVTFFWAHMSVDKEIAEIASYAKAAKAANLKHVIWSTLEDSRNYMPLSDDRMPTLMGKYKVPHFDGKGESDHFFTDAGVPATFLTTSFYWENFIYFGVGPKKGEDGKIYFTLPIGKSKMAGIASEDIGKCAYSIFKKGPSMAGKTIGIAGEQLSGDEMAAAMSKALGQEVKYAPVTAAVFRSFGFPGADDLGNMFQFFDEYADDLNKTRDVKGSRDLNPELQNFDTWLKENAKKIPLS